MRISVALALLVAYSVPPLNSASGYPVAESLGLADLEKQSDLICKVEAVATAPAEGKPFKDVPGFQVVATKLNVIETYKGATDGQISFLHYMPKKDDLAYSYMPQNYQFEPGGTYILFAKKADRDGVFQQLWENHRTKEDQGLVRAADKATHGKHPIRDVLWAELTKLLASAKRENTLYAIGQLDQMSGGGYDHLSDFDRLKTLTAIEPFIRSQDAEIAKAAITALGSRNPYLSPGYAPNWLATIGKGSIPGYATFDAPEKVPAAQFWKPLVEVADGKSSPEVRALAILALGRTRELQLKDHLKSWLAAPEPAVRQSAAILLADFPDLATNQTVERLAKDPESRVRAGIATAIGFGQLADHVNWLQKLVDDPDPNVAQAAAMSLMSLPLKDTRKTLEALVDHSEYRPLIVNALAAEKPADYLDALCDIVRHDRQPAHWWGGSIPWGVSWDILYHYLQSHPDEMKQGRLNSVLDAMESPAYFSSSEPRDLYALYLRQGMTEQAKSFREKCGKRLTYDIDYYFKMADENPQTYQRER